MSNIVIHCHTLSYIVTHCHTLSYIVIYCHALSYIVMFTCTVVRAIHLEGAKPQTAEEFIRKLNAFIAWKTRPAAIISDNGGAFKVTAEWIKIL